MHSYAFRGLAFRKSGRQNRGILGNTLESNQDLIPVWFELEREFYVDLRQLAEKHGMSMAELLREALRRFESESALGLSAESLVQKRWANKSPEERSDFARRIAERRWKKSTE